MLGLRALLALAPLLARAGALGEAGKDPCKCLSWMHQVKLFPQLCTDLGPTGCAVYSQLGNVCANSGDGPTPMQQCLVPSTCKEAQPVEGMPPGLALKACVPSGRDRALWAYRPEVLQRYAKIHKIEVGDFLRVAYPRKKVSTLGWMVASQFWNLSSSKLDEAKAHMTPAGRRQCKLSITDRATLEQLVNGSERSPVILDSEDGLPPFAVLAGRRLFEVVVDTAKSPTGLPSSATQAPCAPCKLRCLRGCEAAEGSPWEDLVHLGEGTSIPNQKDKQHQKDKKHRAALAKDRVHLGDGTSIPDQKDKQLRTAFAKDLVHLEKATSIPNQTGKEDREAVAKGRPRGRLAAAAEEDTNVTSDLAAALRPDHVKEAKRSLRGKANTTEGQNKTTRSLAASNASDPRALRGPRVRRELRRLLPDLERARAARNESQRPAGLRRNQTDAVPELGEATNKTSAAAPRYDQLWLMDMRPTEREVVEIF
mmetsp:Transcript_37079/g.106047  ORF Transcript_37079/g.106047 Transcript_37079/m.106047 type:complete len:481 (-) Transcript_37079:81-1523(-)